MTEKLKKELSTIENQALDAARYGLQRLPINPNFDLSQWDLTDTLRNQSTPDGVANLMTSERDAVLQNIATQRRAQLSSSTSILFLGHVLVYLPSTNTSDGGPMATTDGFFSVHDEPPMGLWFYVDWPNCAMAWIPRFAMERAHDGVCSSIMASLAWAGSPRLDDMDWMNNDIEGTLTEIMTRPLPPYDDNLPQPVMLDTLFNTWRANID